MATLHQLQQQLVNAREARHSVMMRGRSSRVPLTEYLSASEKVLEAERALAVATGDQYAIPLSLGFHPEAAVSAPVLLQNDDFVFLTFNAVTIALDGSRGKAGTACIEFDLCSWTSFGYPNDEALAGHPLYGRGLNAYGIFEVHNSHWGRRMTDQNRVSFPNTKDFSARHLIFTFHDSTFECLCKGIKSSSLSTKPYADIFATISGQVFNKHVET